MKLTDLPEYIDHHMVMKFYHQLSNSKNPDTYKSKRYYYKSKGNKTAYIALGIAYSLITFHTVKSKT